MHYAFFPLTGPQFGLSTLTAISVTPLALLAYGFLFRRWLRPGLREGCSPARVRVAAGAVALGVGALVLSLDAAAPFTWLFLGLVGLAVAARLAWPGALPPAAGLAGLSLVVRALVLLAVGS